MRLRIVIAATTLLAGCGLSATSPTPQYQFEISPTGQIFRLNTNSGDVTLVEVGVPALVVGSLYKSESGAVLRYVGDGEFEARPPLSSFDKK